MKEKTLNRRHEATPARIHTQAMPVNYRKNYKNCGDWLLLVISKCPTSAP